MLNSHYYLIIPYRWGAIYLGRRNLLRMAALTGCTYMIDPRFWNAEAKALNEAISVPIATFLFRFSSHREVVRFLMDPERVPTRRQSEATSPAHGVGEEKSGTIPVDPFNPSRPNTGRIDTRNPSAGNLLSSTSSEKSVINDETVSPHHPRNIHDHIEQSIQQPLSARHTESNSEKKDNKDNQFSNTTPNIDWVVPTEEKKDGKRTVGERLQPTLDIAIIERDKYATKAKWTGYALNAAIGSQVLLGSLTTGLSALAVSGGRSTAMATTALGALATLVASYLARARGSNEPELSIARNKDLDQFIRECRAFQLDHGHILGNELDADLLGFRHRFEELLGNANGERKLSPPA